MSTQVRFPIPPVSMSVVSAIVALGVCPAPADAQDAAVADAAAPSAEQAPNATPEVSPEQVRARNRETVAAEFSARQVQYAGNPDAYVRPGLLALRKGGSGRVELSAEATSIENGTIIEFLLIGEASGHDYESLFVSLAPAKEIDAALKFIGMKPGRNAYALPMDFWPKGERVLVSLKGRDGSADIPLERLVTDRREDSDDGKPPFPGFVYCGSGPARPDPDRDEKEALAADYDGPCSVLSVYNEPTTLLDIPVKASQDEVYESFVANPAPGVKAGDLVTLVLTPEARGASEGPRVTDMTLAIGETPDGLRCGLAKADGTTVARDADIASVLAMLSSMADRFDSFVTLDWGDNVTFGAATALARQLDAADSAGSFRIEAPRKGQPYYRAFLPDPEWLDRAKRPTQPLELRFAKDADSGAVSATLVSVVEVWPEDGSTLDPEIKATDMAVPSVEALSALAVETGNEIPAMLVYVPASLTLGEALPYVRILQASRPNVYFFTEAVQ